MYYTIINANFKNPSLDITLSEWIYQLESKNKIINYVKLESIPDESACESIHLELNSSDMVIYIAPLDQAKAMERLYEFLDYHTGSHPPIYLILSPTSLLSVEDVESYVDHMEIKAKTYKSMILDVQYLKKGLSIINR